MNCVIKCLFIGLTFCSSLFAEAAAVDWPNLNLITKGHNILLVSLGGAGMFETSGAGDEIADIANDAAFQNNQNRMVTISGKPDCVISEKNREIITTTVVCSRTGRNILNFFLPGAGETVCITRVLKHVWDATTETTVNDEIAGINEYNFAPDPYEIADQINKIASNMAPNRKIVLVGKSMGAYLLWKAHAILNSKYNLPIDLFILVDASGTIKYHDNETPLNIERNVKRVLNFHQNIPKDQSPDLFKQCGYKVNYLANPDLNSKININVNLQNSDPAIGQLCNNVSHMNIDNCPLLLQYIKRIISQTINVNLAAINLILDN